MVSAEAQANSRAAPNTADKSGRCEDIGHQGKIENVERSFDGAALSHPGGVRVSAAR